MSTPSDSTLSDEQVAAIDVHLDGLEIGRLSIIDDQTGERLPLFALDVLRDECRRLVRRHAIRTNRELTRAECYLLVLDRAGQAAPPQSPLAKTWFHMKIALSRLAQQKLDAEVNALRQDARVLSEVDPLVRVQLDAGEVIEPPLDWPQLPAATPGESLAAYMNRAIVGDPFFQRVEKHCRQLGLTPLRLHPIRPAARTLVWWQTKYPNRNFALPWAAAFPDERRTELRQLRELVYWRLMVVLFERLRGGGFVVSGQRIDVVEGTPRVAANLWANPDMILLPSGEFRREPRPGHPPPGVGLPSFIELALWPATAIEKKSEQKQKRTTHRQRLTDALLALNEDGVDISSRLIRVDDLHKMAEEKAGSKRHSSKQTFERALKDARDSLSKD